MANKTQLIDQRLDVLRELCPDVEAAAVISVEGLTMLQPCRKRWMTI